MFLVYLSLELGLSLNAVRMFSTSDLATYMAYFDIYPPGQADNVRAARMSYYSANQFKKPVRFKTLMNEFAPARHDTTINTDSGLVTLLEGVTVMPDDIAERFH